MSFDAIKKVARPFIEGLATAVVGILSASLQTGLTQKKSPDLLKVWRRIAFASLQASGRHAQRTKPPIGLVFLLH